MSRTKGVVLWNARETKEKCEEFVRDYAKMRADLLDHFEHKGHVALKYADDWDGFFAYCREKLKLESKPDTIRLQLSTAEVSREVGVDIPMVITRHLAKLPPGKRKEVYDEVIGAREVAGQRSANQMEPDVRKVVRRELGIIEPPRPSEMPDIVIVENTEPAYFESLGYKRDFDPVSDTNEPDKCPHGVPFGPLDKESGGTHSQWCKECYPQETGESVVGVDVASEPDTTAALVTEHGEIINCVSVGNTGYEETSGAEHNRKVDEHYRDMGIATPAEQMAALRDGPWETAQEPRTDDTEEEAANQPAEEPMDYRNAYSEARGLLCRWSAAYAANDQEVQLAVYMEARTFLDSHREQ